MLNTEQKNQFSEILEELGKTLDITETQYNTVVKSYEAVGLQLSKNDSTLAPYKPEILPQGSFMLGTMIQPVHEKDDLDIDLVCQLIGKKQEWTQYDLKQKVGDQIKANANYARILKKPEGRRCWTLLYSEAANYHLDILPAIVDNGYRIILEKAFSATELKQIDQLALRITDCKEENYRIERNHLNWLRSNPFGYGRWFYQQATLDFTKAFSINESIAPIPKYRKEKLPLQRVVQILKRHRDMVFNGHEHKPISIIITTLASKAYNKEPNIIDALQNVIERMPLYIEERYSPKYGKTIKWIGNPINDEENFADKWVNEPQREQNFYKWMNQVKLDIENVLSKRGLNLIKESLEKPFGKNVTLKTFSNYADNALKQRESGILKMAAGTGTLSNAGRTSVPQHNPFGKNE